MKNTILILFVIIASIGNAQGVHENRFFKKTTNKKVNISDYLKSEGFIEVEARGGYSPGAALTTAYCMELEASLQLLRSHPHHKKIRLIARFIGLKCVLDVL